MILVLRNTTGSLIVVDDTGVPIQAASTYTIQPQDVGYWAASSDIDPFLVSGDLVLERDGNDLSPDDAKEQLHRLRIHKVSNDGTLVKRDTLSVDYVGGLTVIDDGYGSVKVSGGSGETGYFHKVVCVPCPGGHMIASVVGLLDQHNSFMTRENC